LLDFWTLSIVWYSEKSAVFQKLDVCVLRWKCVWGGGGSYSVQWLRLTLSNGPNWLDTYFSHEGGNRSSFWNAFFSEYQTVDKVQKSSDSNCNTLSSELFRINMKCVEATKNNSQWTMLKDLIFHAWMLISDFCTCYYPFQTSVTKCFVIFRT
jgi:hypothetical protein